MTRDLVYYIACSADGFIARADGSWDYFLHEGDHLADIVSTLPETVPTHLRAALGVQGENRCFDTVLMGRNTMNVGLDAGITNPYAHLKQYLFSRSMQSSPHPDVHLVSTDPLAFVRQLKQEPGMAIWLCGGSVLAGALAPEIDEVILKVNPVMIGAGIPLFQHAIERLQLRMISSKVYASGFLMTRYRVQR